MFFIDDFIEKICNIIATFIVIAIILLGLAIMLAIPYGIIILVNTVDYSLDKSKCDVFVNNSQVYSGACHFVDISSIGENGNSKRVTIYKDIPCMQPLKVYVSENIEVKNAE